MICVWPLVQRPIDNQCMSGYRESTGGVDLKDDTRYCWPPRNPRQRFRQYIVVCVSLTHFNIQARRATAFAIAFTINHNYVWISFAPQKKRLQRTSSTINWLVISRIIVAWSSCETLATKGPTINTGSRTRNHEHEPIIDQLIGSVDQTMIIN